MRISKQDRKLQSGGFSGKNYTKAARFSDRGKHTTIEQNLVKLEKLTGCRFGKPKTCRNPDCEHNADLD